MNVKKTRECAETWMYHRKQLSHIQLPLHTPESSAYPVTQAAQSPSSSQILQPTGQAG